MRTKHISVYLLVVAALGACGKDSSSDHGTKSVLVNRAPDDDDSPPAQMSNVDRGLMLVDPLIVGDARAQNNGTWGFGSLFQGLAPNGDAKLASDLAEAWLANWQDDRAAKMREKILCPWRNASTGHDDCRAGQLDMDKAPFQLLAIVNRADLRLADTCDDAGEARFVFGLKDAPDDAPFHVIFEYAVPTDFNSVGGWAAAWSMLAETPCTDAGDCGPYLNTLQMLTSPITNSTTVVSDQVFIGAKLAGDPAPAEMNGPARGVAAPGIAAKAPPLPGPSNLRHLRTHERATGATEFREFVLHAENGDDAAPSARFEQTAIAAAGATNLDSSASGAKCLGCHTGDTKDAALAGQRFNVGDPGAKAMGGVPSGISDELPGRRDQLNLLLNSECMPTGEFSGAGRSTPW